MIKVQQVGALTPPLLKMIQSGGAEPFMEGDGRVFAYHIGASSVGDVIDIVRNHTRGGIIVLDRSTEAFISLGHCSSNSKSEDSGLKLARAANASLTTVIARSSSA